MKIATSLCFALALLSPAFALRGTRKTQEKKQRQRRAEVPVGEAAAATAEGDAPAAAVEEIADVADELFTRDSYYENAPIPGEDAVFGQTDPTLETVQELPLGYGPNDSPPLNLGPFGGQADLETGDMNLENTNYKPGYQQYGPDGEYGADYGDGVEELGWFVDNYALYGNEYRKKKSSSSRSKNQPKDGTPVSADGLCNTFCADYIATCEGANAYFNPPEPRGSPARRRLIAGEQLVIQKLEGTTVFESLDDCREACMLFPRPTNPREYLGVSDKTVGIETIGDTFWCRRTHLDLAKAEGNNFAALTHCPFAAPDGGGLCINAPIILEENKNPFINGTAYDFIRAGAETSRHLGYCQMYYNDIVADCTSAGIDDRTLPLALALIPMETEIIILNNNVGKKDPMTGNVIGKGITNLPTDLMKGLLFPENIRGLYIDDGNIATIAPNALTSLTKLQALSLNQQQLTAIPEGAGRLLENMGELRDFSLYNTQSNPGKLMSIPMDLFTGTIVNRVVISGHRGLTGLPASLFMQMDNFLTVLILSNNGFTNAGITTTMFRNLINLQIMDMSNNQFMTAEAGWFNMGNMMTWAISLRNLYLQENPITIVQDGIFDFDNCALENVLLHDTDIITIPVGVFDFCDKTLISYTVSPRV